MPVEQLLETLERLETSLAAQDSGTGNALHIPYGSLDGYYGYLHDMTAGYIKDPVQREEQPAIVRGWQQDVEWLDALCNRNATASGR